MKALTFWRTVVSDESDFLGRVLAVLRANGIRFCVIGGQAVNAYADPVVSLDLDIAVGIDQIEAAAALLRRDFDAERSPHSINVGAQGSALRVQLQTDARYAAFVAGAIERDVLGLMLPVADIADVLQGKVWAASDPACRPSKRLKDLADIARIIETRSDLADAVPSEIRSKLI